MATKQTFQRDVTTETYAYANHTHHKCSVSWGAIFGGALGAISISLILLILGSGLGFASVSPWANHGATATAFTVGAAIWLVITQWTASGVGGFITGRLRTRASNIHTNEVFFRDTAHGFITWSLATIITVTVLAGAVTSIIGGGAKAGTAVVAAGAAGAGHEAAKDSKADNANGYYVDNLFRSDKTAATSEDSRAETSRILAKDIADGKISDDDKTRLKTIVVQQTRVSDQEASTRVDNILSQIDSAKAQAKQAADDAKKAATAFAFATALSMFLGAFIASAAAALGGIHRDEYDNLESN